MAKSTCNVLINIANFLVGAMVTTAGVLKCIGAIGGGAQGFQIFIIGMFLVFFGLMILLVEIRLPNFITAYAGFMATFFGRGMWYIFLGCLVLVPPPQGANQGENWFLFIAAIFILIVGFLWILLQFIAAVDRPRPVYVVQQPPTTTA